MNVIFLTRLPLTAVVTIPNSPNAVRTQYHGSAMQNLEAAFLELCAKQTRENNIKEEKESHFVMETRNVQFPVSTSQYSFVYQLRMSTDLNLNQRQATKQLVHRENTEMQNVLEGEAAPAAVRSALPRSVRFFRHVPCPGDEVLTQIGDNGFSTEHLWAEDVGQYTFIVVEVDSEKLSLKRHEERSLKTSWDCPVI